MKYIQSAWYYISNIIALCVIIIILLFIPPYLYYKPPEIPIKARTEISKKQYQKILEHSIKYGYYKYLAWEALSDGFISEEEFSNMETIYSRIARMDNVNLLLQEKCVENYEKSTDDSDK